MLLKELSTLKKINKMHDSLSIVYVIDWKTEVFMNHKSMLLLASRWLTERGSSFALRLRPLTFTSTGSISTSSLNHSVSPPFISRVGPNESTRLSLGSGIVSPAMFEIRISLRSSFLSFSPESLSSLLVIIFSSRSLGSAFRITLKMTYPMRAQRTRIRSIQNSILSFQRLGTYASWPSQARHVLLSEQTAHPEAQFAHILVVVLDVA